MKYGRKKKKGVELKHKFNTNLLRHVISIILKIEKTFKCFQTEM